MPSTSELTDPVARLERAARDRRTARERVAAVGEQSGATGEAALRNLREAIGDLRSLFTRYEERATGDGDFAAFIEFQEEIAAFTEELPAALPERETFEAVDDLLQQRRLTESDFDDARRRLAGAEDALAPLDDLEDARERYENARRDVRRRLDEVDARIDDLERLQRLGEADLDAPVDRLRDPIETYDDAVLEAFRTFRAEAPARDVLDLVATTRLYPLAPFRAPPDDLHEYVRTHEAGTEPISRLLEYADYSRSKLDHYVDDADALKRNVATQQTYLERLDAEPLTVGWPPPEADVLRWQCEERVSVVGRFAPDVVGALRDVRELTRRGDYATLRESAVARERLTDDERERVRSGAVEDDLADAREKRERLADALDEYPAL